MTDIDNFNNQSIGEEIANSVAHGIGAMLACAGTAVLIIAACLNDNIKGIVGSSLYGFSLIFLYLMSTLYHAVYPKRAKAVFQIFDHCSIFILILGSYVPICLSLLPPRMGWTLLSINIFLTVLGVIANAVNIKKWHRLSLVLYLLMGWSIVFCLEPLLQAVGWRGLYWLVAGGLSYSIGVFFYQASYPKFMHTVWHIFVLSGSILHYFFILFFIMLR